MSAVSTAGGRPYASTIGFGNVLRSELTKLRTVRATYWTTLLAVLGTVGLGALICARTAYNINRGDQGVIGFDPTLTSLNGIYLAQIAAGALGVLTISSEYGTGMIRATLGAVPQRRALLAAKGLVFAIATLIAGEILSFAAFTVGQGLLSGAHAGAALGQPGVLRATIGGGLYLTAVGLLGFGLGALIRHTAGALSAFFGILFALRGLVDILPSGWQGDVSKYMPPNAGSQIITVVRGHDTLPPWAGLGVLCLYAVAAMGAATALIGHRDA
ncbi:MAG: ABC transporter permease [Jatrophihabitantaceae bacterium]